MNEADVACSRRDTGGTDDAGVKAFHVFWRANIILQAIHHASIGRSKPVDRFVKHYGVCKAKKKQLLGRLDSVARDRFYASTVRKRVYLNRQELSKIL